MQLFYFYLDKIFVFIFEVVLFKEEMISKIGLIVIGDSFIVGQEKIDVIKGYFLQVLVVEMEGVVIV